MKEKEAQSEKQDSYISTQSKHGNIDDYLTKILGKKYSDYRSTWLSVQSELLETKFPLYISLETEMRCNLRCTMCAFSSEEAIRPQQYSETMPDSMFDKILGEAIEHSCPSMGFNVLNEPLMDPKIISRITEANKRGILDTRINSNATLLTEKRANGIIDSGLTRLMVSLDAFKPETYNSVRVRGNYDKVLRNIERFLNIREKRGAKLPLLRVTFVKLATNQDELQDFVNYWNDRADYIGIQEYTPPVFNDERYKSYQTGDQIVGEGYTCRQPFERMIIRGNGQIFPCCSQMNYKLPIGNINDISLLSAWNSKLFKELRTEMRQRSTPADSVCGMCMRGMMNV